MANATHFTRCTFAAKEIDTVNGVIPGVAVITIGEAKGHGLFVDAKTIETVMACAGKYADGVRVVADHSGGILDTIGLLRNFRVDGATLRADMHLLEADPASRAKVLEMAAKIADTFGLSITFDHTVENIDGKPFVRCTNLVDVALVTEPAANPALFSANPMDIADVLKAIEAITAQSAECSARLTALEAKLGAMPGPEVKTDIAALSAKIDTVQTDAIAAVARRLGVSDASHQTWSIARPATTAPQFPKLKAAFDAAKTAGRGQFGALADAAKAEPGEYAAFLKSDLRGDPAKL